MVIKLKEGDTAPDFSAIAQNGAMITLKSCRGRWCVLYFYPKDDTPGCTKEACGFRDAWTTIQKTGSLLLGVSPDSIKSHEKFSKKFNLPFLLLSDEEKKISKAFGVWGKKKFMGRSYMGIFRTTFLVDPKGKIRKIWDHVKPAEHADEVLTELKARI